ncbi:negative elongation factor A [Ditylenchus destructor]|uniref:Negative elongation factor A n=1 Tax=Ditylenchus destructor TaxID=166010 RepID=A0AAD4NFE6_9BILA|nr:negative elongation factor A [Ditylenchus destructor]
MNSESSKLRDQDLVKWIENKLGDPNERWGGRQAAALLSREMVVELENCFQGLEPHVKLKIIQSISHLSPRLVEMWKEPLNNLLELARRDADDWVETIADMYRDFPNQGCIRCEPSNKESYFNKTLEELQRITKMRMEIQSVPRTLPPDHAILSHSAIKARFGYAEIELKKHFKQKVNQKAQQLLQDVKRASEQRKKEESKKASGPITSFPIKMRSTARKPNNQLPMKGIPTVNTVQQSAGFTNEPRKFRRELSKREGGAMLIDIAELPNPSGRKRRTDTASSQASTASSRRGKKMSDSDEMAVTPKSTVNSEFPIKRGKRKAGADDENSYPTSSNDYQCPTQGQVKMSEPIRFVKAGNRDDSEQTPHPFMSNTESVSDTADETATQENDYYTSNYGSGLGPSTSIDYAHEQQRQNAENEMSQTSNEASSGTPMSQFDELLKSANKITPVAHNLIAAFLSGNKTNPLQSKLGTVVTLPLSETLEKSIDANGMDCFILAETFFQMDYGSGEWKRLRKSRTLKPEEVAIRTSASAEHILANESLAGNGIMEQDYAAQNNMISSFSETNTSTPYKFT